MMPGERGGVEHEAARVLRRVAVRASEPAARRRHAPARRRTSARASSSFSGVDDVRARRRGAAPAVEERVVAGQRARGQAT